MAKSNNQKAKILYLEQLLCQTGENNTISMQQILSILEEHDIRAERKSIYDDFDVLRSFGMDIRYRRGKNGGYYLVESGSDADAVKTRIHIDHQASHAKENLIEKNDIQENSIDNRTDVIEEIDTSDHQEYIYEMKNISSNPSGKQMKLLIEEEGLKQELQRFFGKQIQYKETENQIVGIVPATDSTQFFGWLTAMGKSVRILKPKKIAQSYREYLKMLAKEYKGI